MANKNAGKEALEWLRRLGDTGAHSDFTIVCGDDQYHVHKAVFCTRSRFFETVFKHPMKESATGTVELHGDDPDAVRSMVEYMYRLDYDHIQDSDDLQSSGEDENYANCEPHPCTIIRVTGEHYAVDTRPGARTNYTTIEVQETNHDDGMTTAQRICRTCDSLFHYVRRPTLTPAPVDPEDVRPLRLPWPTNEETPNLLHHCRVYALAERLNILLLKTLAIAKFRAHAQKFWDHPQFLEAAREAYSSTPACIRGMRDAVVEAICYRHEPCGLLDLLDKEDVRDLLQEPDIAADILQYLFRHFRII